MNTIVAAIVGSGTKPFIAGILPPSQRGYQVDGGGIRTGTQVMLGNPEDLLAVDAFAASGVTVGTTAIELIGPLNNPLPRCHEILLENVGSNPVFISHKAVYTDADAWQLSPVATSEHQSVIRLPLLHNNSIYARATGGASSVRILIF